MPVRYLSDAELARLSGWPEEMAGEDAVTFFTLTGDDLAWLAGFNAAGRAAVPQEAMTAAATSFVPGPLARLPGRCPRAGLRRRRLPALLGTRHPLRVQTGLRSGDVWVPGSRRYTDPATLLPPDQWAGKRDGFCTITGTDPDPRGQLARLEEQLRAAVAGLSRCLPTRPRRGLARLGKDGELIVSPLPADGVGATLLALQ
jgi:hypothetical protein